MIPQCLTYIACKLAAGPSAHSSSGIQLKVYVWMYACMKEQVIGKINLPVMKAQAISAAQEES